MRLTYDNQTYVVGWRYIYSWPLELLKAVGLTPAMAKVMKQKDLRQKLRPILELIGLECPTPSRVECFIVISHEDNTSTEVGRRYISLRGHDQHDNEKARTFSLDKVLKYTFPGVENRPLRKAVWNTYHDRKNNKVKKTGLTVVT